MSKELKDFTAADFVTPKGTTIEASLELTPGECGIDADENGWDYDGTGTEHSYDGQESMKDALGRPMFLDNERKEWALSETGWVEPAKSDPLKDAAPAMLKALEMAERSLAIIAVERRKRKLPTPELDAVRAAIAAARGEG